MDLYGHRGEGQRVFETVLVADRGLLAVRVIRCCQRLGIQAVTCVAEGDEDALHARLADEAIQLGARADPDSPADLIDAVIEAARVCGAAAVHPGGGGSLPLSAAVLAAGLTWVGAVPADGGAVASWRETVRRDDRPLLWETGPTDPATEPRTAVLTGPDRLVEAVTGVDLVERQLRHAAGERLEEIPAATGHAVQAAVYAGPATLVPVAVSGWTSPVLGGVVIDSVLAEHACLTGHDGVVLARITAHGHDREQALARLTAAADSMAVAEPPTELAALRALLREPSVAAVLDDRN